MLRKLKLAAAALLVLAGASAQAATISGSSTLNGNGVTDFSTDGLLSFDLDQNNLNPVSLTIDLSAADLSAGTISWNAIFANLTSGNLGSYSISVAGADISFVGDLTDTFQTPIAGLSTTLSSALITFPGAGEAAGFELGNPLGFTSADWELSNFTGSSITVYLQGYAVPEPSLGALLAVGAVLATLRFRRAL